jgi:hypothetical protein
MGSQSRGDGLDADDHASQAVELMHRKRTY